MTQQVQPVNYIYPYQTPRYICASCVLPSAGRNYCLFDNNEVDYFVKQRENALPYLSETGWRMLGTGQAGSPGRLQASSQTGHRIGICPKQQTESRRGGYPRICRKSPPITLGSTFRTEKSVRYRPRIPYRMQAGLSGCTRQSAPQRDHLSASPTKRTKNSGKETATIGRDLSY